MRNGFDVIPGSLGQALGWALLHFTWQGALLGILCAAFLRLAARGSATRRYQAGVATLVAMLAFALFTFVYQYQLHTPGYRGAVAGEETGPGGPPAGAFAASPAEPAPRLISNLPGRLLPAASRLEPYLPRVAGAWLVCILILYVRLAGSLLYVGHLRTAQTRLVDPGWQTKIDALARQLAISRPVRLLESARVTVPVTMGYLRPVILLPAGLLTGLPPAHLETILVHELAHIARRDYLVNLFQAVLEILFFFHPAVWWVSAVVRREREYCCDDATVRAGQDPLCYLEALTALETYGGGHSLSLAVTGQNVSLLKRAERLLKGSSARPAGAYPLMVLAGVALGLALLAACTLQPPEPLPPGSGSRAVAGTRAAAAGPGNRSTAYAAYDRLDDTIAVWEQEKAALYFTLSRMNSSAAGSSNPAWRALRARFDRKMHEIQTLKQQRDALLPEGLPDGTPERQPRRKQPVPPTPPEAPRRPVAKDVFEAIRENLVRDGLIREGEAYTFRFSYRTMYVNGKRQPQPVLDKYKEIARSYGIEKNGPEDRHISKE